MLFRPAVFIFIHFFFSFNKQFLDWKKKNELIAYVNGCLNIGLSSVNLICPQFQAKYNYDWTVDIPGLIPETRHNIIGLCVYV